MPPFKDEHILIIAPGSQTTLAQLGLPESFTPARFRFPTRMFPTAKKDEWEPYKVRKKTIKVQKEPVPNTSNDQNPPPTANESSDSKDVEMKDTADGEGQNNGTNEQKQEDKAPIEEEEQTIFVEDTTSDEGAVYPIHNGSIQDWTCLFALLTHIYNTLSPPFHTPIMLIAQPAWTMRDRETITQFIFEKFKTPAFCMMDSALAVCYAYGTANATVIDIGHGKADVTAVTDFMVCEHGRGIALEGCGGEALTDRLLQLLGPKGFTRDMCEQLKKNNICEILPPGTPLPTSTQAQKTESSAEPAKPAPTSTPGKGPDMPRNANNGEGEDEDGELDVAKIVSGDTTEYLAKKEKEKAEKAAARKGAAGDASGSKGARLPNSKKEKASFQYQESNRPQDEGSAGDEETQSRREIEVGRERFLAATPSESNLNGQCGYGIFDLLAAQIHHTIHSVQDAPKRSELWDSLIILGSGSKIKGFPQGLLSTITQKYVLSPSSGTIFTSELPSAFSTPLPTGGTNTPAPLQNPGPLHHPAAHGVNPLLVAATHANNPATNAPPSTGDPHGSAHYKSTGHSQTPTSIKLLKPPEYFPEWKPQGSGGANAALGNAGPNANNNNNNNNATSSSSNSNNNNKPANNQTNAQASGGTLTGVASGSNNVGMEEATFLGAQVAAKVVFVIDQGISKGFLGRVEYNEAGPSAIHEYSL